MNKQIIEVPGDIRFISQWTDFLNEIKESPCIIDKRLTGCGFTEWCISSDLNIILCSPRRVLLNSKEKYHPGEVLYARNDLEAGLSYDKNLTSERPAAIESCPEGGIVDDADGISRRINLYKASVKSWALSHFGTNTPCKILVTYDSFRLVKEALQEEELFDSFLVVIDEFQSIFTDSRFKSTTELELLSALSDVKSVWYVSATPMMESYLDKLDEFKNLPYYELDWSSQNPYRVSTPDINPKKVFNNTSITKIACEIIESYRKGQFERLPIKDNLGNIQIVESREAVFYVNSVKNICDIIKKAGLKNEEVNILCAKTPDNEKKIRAAMKPGRGVDIPIGEVPKEGEQHKMFTLCTRTVYLGADFCSTCARSFIFSDANIDSLSVDITLDLPQILGRQRLDCNPWKNKAELYYKVINTDQNQTIEQFREAINRKIARTESLLRSYDNALVQDKHDLAETYQYVARSANYKSNYVAVNTHGGKDLKPVKNDLVILSEQRAWEIQHIDFKDRCSVFTQLGEVAKIPELNESISDMLSEFDGYTRFTDKMRVLCEFIKKNNPSAEQVDFILSHTPSDYRKYIMTLGPDQILSLSCIKARCEQKFSDMANTEIKDLIMSNFIIGEKISWANIKIKLQDLYTKCGINKKATASDLEEYFSVRECKIQNKETGKRDKAFEIIKKKD